MSICNYATFSLTPFLLIILLISYFNMRPKLNDLVNILWLFIGRDLNHHFLSCCLSIVAWPSCSILLIIAFSRSGSLYRSSSRKSRNSRTMLRFKASVSFSIIWPLRDNSFTAFYSCLGPVVHSKTSQIASAIPLRTSYFFWLNFIKALFVFIINFHYHDIVGLSKVERFEKTQTVSAKSWPHFYSFVGPDNGFSQTVFSKFD